MWLRFTNLYGVISWYDKEEVAKKKRFANLCRVISWHDKEEVEKGNCDNYWKETFKSIQWN